MFHILIVEDDKELRNLFGTVLSDKGYIPHFAENGLEALDVLDNQHIDLMISDVMMPEMDGYELTSELRSAGFSLPILMITAKEKLADKRDGFLAGTDDYMIKPVNLQEMIWRVEALLRRSQIITKRKIQLGNTLFDADALSVTFNQEETSLPQKEFLLLFKLVSSPNRIFTKRQILDGIWGIDNEVDPHTLEVHISRLRDRFKDNPDFEIVTARGLGYKAVAKQ